MSVLKPMQTKDVVPTGSQQAIVLELHSLSFLLTVPRVSNEKSERDIGLSEGNGFEI